MKLWNETKLTLRYAFNLDLYALASEKESQYKFCTKF